MIALFPVQDWATAASNDEGSWQARAITASRQVDRRAKLAAHVFALTNRVLATEAIFIDDTNGIATALVDGVLFRLRRDGLVIVDRCSHCGTREFESPQIRSLADLGHALDVWQPYCTECRPDDPPDESSW